MSNNKKKDKLLKAILEYEEVESLDELRNKATAEIVTEFLDALVGIDLIDHGKIKSPKGVRFSPTFVEGKGYEITIKYGTRQWIVEDEA